MDALAIGDALVAKYQALTPPSGYPAIRRSTVRIPNNITMSPFVTGLLVDTEGVLGPQMVDYEMHWHVLFHYAKHTGDLARDMTAMLAWHGVLWSATWSGMKLGLAASGVNKAYPTTITLATLTFGGQEWYGWDCAVTVDISEQTVMTP